MRRCCILYLFYFREKNEIFVFSSKSYFWRKGSVRVVVKKIFCEKRNFRIFVGYFFGTSSPTLAWSDQSRVFDEISFRENFPKLATKRCSCFAKMRDEFCGFCSFAKLPRLQKKRFSRNTKIAKMKNT